MATYSAKTKSNIFCVKDMEAFKRLMDKVCTSDGEEICISIYPGNLVSFACDGSITGIPADDSEDPDIIWDDFAQALSNIVAEDDAVLIHEIGYEKLRCVDGSVAVITAKGMDFVTLEKVGVKLACEMLENPEWSLCAI